MYIKQAALAAWILVALAEPVFAQSRGPQPEASPAPAQTANQPAPSPMTPTSPTAGPSPAVQEAVQLAQIGALGSRCSWLLPIDVEAVRLAGEERIAMASVQGGEVARKAAMDAIAKAEKDTVQPCSGAGVDGPTGARATVQRIAQNTRTALLLRAAAISSMTDPYADITTVTPLRDTLQMGVQAARQQATAAGQTAAFDAFAARQSADASKSIMLICPERRTVRTSNGPRACPTIEPADQAMIPYARTLVASAETFAPLFAAALKQEDEAQTKAAADAERLAKKQRDEARKKVDQVIAKHPEIGNYYMLVDLKGGYADPNAPPAECTDESWLYDLGGPDVLRTENKDMIIFYAPMVRLSDGARASWTAYGFSKVFGDPQGTYLQLQEAEKTDWRDETYRKAFKPLSQGEINLGIKDNVYLTGLTMNILRPSVDGVPKKTFQRCRSK